MNQADLQKLAEERILDAKNLLDGGRWEFAYYAAGYAVECALKSCLLARMIHTGWVFQEKLKPDQCLTHDFMKLIDIAGLTQEIEAHFITSAAGNGVFTRNWEKTKLWKVSSRYELKTEIEARELFAAITDDPDGVLKWLQNYW